MQRSISSIIVLSMGLWALPVAAQSIGDTRNGRMGKSHALQVEGPGYEILEKVRHREYRYGAKHLIALVENVADTLQMKSCPLLLVGNLSRRKGGNIPQSKSHNSGRDLDLAFYVTDKKGSTYHPVEFVQFDKALSEDSRGLIFDVERNWLLVETLLSSEEAHIGWIFVADHLRDALLLRAANASPQIQLMASTVLKQPSDSAPHDDHFHIRVYCAAGESPACEETMARWPWVPSLELTSSDSVEAPSTATIPMESPGGLVDQGDQPWSTALAFQWNKLTNHSFEGHQDAAEWYQKNQAAGPRQWWDAGYRAAGCTPCVEGNLANRVDALIAAVSDKPAISYRARVDLTQLTGNPIQTSTWTPQKAGAFWKKWWNRNAHRYGL